MGLFDDLLPSATKREGNAATGLFDDLIPEAPPTGRMRGQVQGRPEPEAPAPSGGFSSVLDEPVQMGAPERSVRPMARGEYQAPEEEAAASPGRGATLRSDPVEADLSAAEWNPETQFGKGVKSGMIGAKQMGAAAATVPLAGATRSMLNRLDAYSRIEDLPQDAARPDIAAALGVDPMSQEANYAAMYLRADEETRKRMRDREMSSILSNKEAMGDLKGLVARYSEEMKATQGRMPNFTDIKDLSDFGDWAAYNTGQAIPYLAGLMAAGAITGPAGPVALGYGMGVGDIQSELIEKGMDPEEAAKYSLAGGVPYAALEYLGPAASLTRGLKKEAASRIAGNYFKRLGREIPKNAVEEFINEAGQEIIKDFTVAGATNEKLVLNEETLLRWVNSGMAGLAGGVAGAPVAALPGGNDTERADSPRLTEDDRRSPIRNDIIDDGKRALEELGVSPAPEVASTGFNQALAPEQEADTRPSAAQDAPPAPVEAPEAPTQPETEEAAQRPSSEPQPQAQTQDPQQPDVTDEWEELPIYDEQGQETGERMRVNWKTGEMLPVTQDAAPEVDTAPATPAPQPQAQTQAPIQPQTPQEELPRDTTAPVESLEEATVGAQPETQRRPSSPTLQKRPVATELKGKGIRIKPGSPIAEELASRGINARTHPGMFSRDGVSDIDNLPAEEWGAYRYEIGEDGNGYLDRNGLIEALEREMRGDPLRVGQQAELQAAADAREAEERFLASTPHPDPVDAGPDMPDEGYVILRPDEDMSTGEERIGSIQRAVRDTLGAIGGVDALSNDERRLVEQKLLDHGGNVEDAVWWQLNRSADDYERPAETTQPRLADQPADGQGARGGEAAQDIPQDAGRPEYDAGAEGQSAPQYPTDRRADERQAPDQQSSAAADPLVAHRQALDEFNRLDAERKISDPQAYFDASSRLAKARDGLADSIAEKGGRIELAAKDGRGAVITPQGDGFQISYFDKRGFSGDTRHKDLRAAVRDAIGQGYEFRADGLLKQNQKGAEWRSPAETQRIMDEVEGRAAPQERTTLEEYAPKSDRRMTHVYAEAKGYRYYVGSYDTQDAAKRAIQAGRAKAPEASFFQTDRADATRIHGDMEAFTATRTQEPNASAEGPTGVDYPNRKLGFRYARSTEPQEGLANIALANMKPGETIRGYGEVTQITDKQIRIKGEDGKTKIFPVDSPRFETLARDVDGIIMGSQHGGDGGDVLTALKRDPAFSYDERQIPRLSDTERGGKDGQNTSILKPLSGKGENTPADPGNSRLSAEVAAINKNLTPENKDGTGYYVAGDAGDIQVDLLGDGDAEITITSRQSRFKGRQKETKEQVKRVLYSEVRDSLSDTARSEIDAYIAEDQAGTVPGTVPSPEQLAELWDAGSKEQREAFVMRAGWVTNKGNISLLGRKIAGRNWADHNENTQAIITKQVMADREIREIINRANDTLIGKNDAGEPIYQRENGEVYRIRSDRKDRPNGYPDFGGDLSVVEAEAPATTEPQEREKGPGDPSLPAIPAELVWVRKRPGQQTPRSVLSKQARWFSSLSREDRESLIRASNAVGYISPDVDLTKIDPDRADEIIGAASLANLETASAAPATTERTEAGEQMVIPGAEQDAGTSLAAEEAAQAKALAETKQRQSKMRTGVAQQEAGPLFDTQGDMFAEPAADNAQRSPQDTLSDALGKKSAKRLFENLRSEWEARENLPDTPESQEAFVEATKKVREARVALSDEIGEANINAALERIESEYSPSKPNEQRSEPTPPNNEAKPARRGAEKIEDFGEVLEGAQKHKAKEWAKRLEDVADDDLANHPLSKSWPEPDYQAMIDEGADPAVVAFIRATREAIPVKPRQPYKVRRWAGEVRLLREMSRGVASGDISMSDVRAKLTDTGISGKVALYERFGHEKSLKDLSLKRQSYSMRNGQVYKPSLLIWEVTRPYGKSVFGNMPRTLAEGATMQEALDAFAPIYEGIKVGAKGGAKRETKFTIWRDRKDNLIHVGKKTGSEYTSLATFEDLAEARKYRAENHDELVEKLAKAKETPFERRRDNRDRIGEDRRNGRDVQPETFQEAFGFRGVQFGNYVEGPRRQADLNRAYDSLLDLSDVIDIPSEAVSLNGTLGLAFGARGRGGKNAAAAHFEADSIVINLTKNSGAGSLAHEWWHGLDNYFSRMRGDNVDFLSERYGAKRDGVRPEMVEAFKAVRDAISDTGLPKRSGELDTRRSAPYWQSGRELTARAFEQYIINKVEAAGGSNDFLANIVDLDFWKAQEALLGHEGDTYPYLKDSEQAAVFKAFDRLFDTMQSEKTDAGTVRLYQRSLDMFYSPLLRAIEGAKQKQAPAKDWKAIIGKLPGVKKAEVEWLGVEEWLDTQDGQVTREDLSNFIRESQIEIVEETSIETTGNPFADDELAAEDGEAFAPQFEQYTEEGGDNYREILLRVPNLHKSGKNKGGRSAREIEAEMEALRNGRKLPQMPLAERQRFEALDEERREAMHDRKAPFVQRAHFSQENIVVHARVKDRTGPNGEKVLFVEEIQSDLASTWRENTESPEVTARRREVEAEFRRLQSEMEDLTREVVPIVWEYQQEGNGERRGTPSMVIGQMFANVANGRVPADRGAKDAVDALRERDGELYDRVIETAQAIGAVDRERLALGTEKKIDPSLPDTPFKEEATYTLMVKRLLRMAAEEGYDKIAWTPGYMQAERWNSAAQSVVDGVEWSAPDADSISAARSASGTDLSEYRYVYLNMADGGDTVDMTVDPSGKVEGTAFPEFAGKQLSQVVGPQLAKQIMSESSGSVSNQKIVFPDSGYAIAYDQQTRKAIDKIARKHGSRVVWDKTMPDFDSGDRVEAEGFEGRADPSVSSQWRPVSNPVWTVEITDDLRAAAMEPMALFKRGQQVQADPAKIKALIPALQQRLKDLMIRGVNVEFDPEMLEQGATEIDRNNAIKVLIGNTLNGVNTLNHEAIHILRAMNLFTQKEWDALAAEAEKVWMAKYDVASRYSDLSRDGQIEEAIAQSFADYIDGKKPATTALGNIFAKVKRFFRAMKETLLGQGITRVEDIFDKVDEGKVGARPRGDAESGARRMYARQPTPVQNLFTQGQSISLPDRGVWDQFWRQNSGLGARLRGARGAFGDRLDRARLKVQDRFLPVLRAQEAIQKATGQPISEDMNAYLKEETFSGKVGRHLFEIDEDFTKPIIDIIAKSKGEMTLDSVGEWLYARHASERNAYIATINRNMPDGGSGMTNAEAAQVLSDVASGPRAADYQAIGDMVDRLKERSLALRVDAGLMTQRQAQMWRTQYRHYVPLKAWDDPQHYDQVARRQGTGRRFSIGGKESRNALGRRSIAFNPLQGIITQAQEVSVRAEKNRVAKALYDLAAQFPSPDLWEVRDVETIRYLSQKTGQVETMTVDPKQTRLAPNEMSVKIGGEEKRVVFHDERLARAAGTIGADQMGPIMQFLSQTSRWFSSVNTMLDPEFVIRNAFRDMTTAQINIRNFGEGDRNALAKAMIKNWPKAFNAVRRGQLNKADTEWTRWYKEFEQSGARVSFWKLEQPEVDKADMNRRIDLATGNKLTRAAKVMTSPRALLSTRDNAVLGMIERTNMAVDNAIRLAAYVEARKKGWSKAQAASLSKNLTVNFNRRGEIGANLNALYPFFNAAMQGTQILFRAMSSKKMAKYMVALVGYGIMEDLVNALISERDDDDELAYDKIPDWKLEMNLVWMRDEGRAYTVPLPYGYNVFPYLGKQIGKVSRGVKEPGEAMSDVIRAAFGAFSPIPISKTDEPGIDLLKAALPMQADIAVETIMNRDWLGRKIRPENEFSDYGPSAYKFYPGASSTSIFLSDVLNRATGGNRATPGGLDISPEYIDHVFGFVTGGAGRFVGRTTDLTAKLIAGEYDLIEDQNIPFKRSIATKTDFWLDRNRYYDFKEEVEGAVASMKLSAETGDPVPDEIRTAAKLHGALKIAEKQMRKIRKEKREAGRDTTLSQREAWEKREKRAIMPFNKRFVDRMGPQAE